MKNRRTYLDELAGHVIETYSGRLEEMTIVFPNRRAGLFFIKSISRLIKRPVWSPTVYGFEDFVYELAGVKPSDPLSLLLDLYDVFSEISDFKEPFDRFYFWGEMLLKDFDEIDKNLVQVRSLFTTLKNLKEIDAQFDILTEEEKDALRGFWGSVLMEKSDHKNNFLRFWASLYPLYRSFQSILNKKGKAYSGMIYRKLCADLKGKDFHWNKGKVLFTGFNALLPAEEQIIKWFLESSNGKVHWDLDRYYFDNPDHEAGLFLRKYSNDPVFRNTFPAEVPSSFAHSSKEINSIASSQYSGQAKIAGNIIHSLASDSKIPDLENTVMVLPDESLLPQVLYSLPDNVGKINITMGYPIKNSSFYSLFDGWLDLHETIRTSKGKSWFYHRNVLKLLNHHLISGISGSYGSEIIKMIEKRNQIYIPSGTFQVDALLSLIFDPLASQDLFEYLIRILLHVRNSNEGSNEDHYFIEREFSLVFYKLFNRLKDIFSERNMQVTPAILRRILKNYAQFEKVPFSGEPLEGLQVMGLLETRNLDFENIIILCANEGQLPRSGPLRSFIPYNVRRAFGLPNPDTLDAIYSYIFYRLLQRSSRVFLIYNTEESSQRKSEPSRYIYQLQFESGFTIDHKFLAMDITVNSRPPIVLKKDDYVMQRLERFLNQGTSRLSPSALNTYMACPLNFYYKYILDIREGEEVLEDLDAATFGSVLHTCMQLLYQPYEGRTVKSESIEMITKKIDRVIGRSFNKYYGQQTDKDEFRFEGKHILGREIIRKYIEKILEKDKELTPFDILGLEKEYQYNLPIEMHGRKARVRLRGIIDRLDRKEDQVRIIDYKSGRDDSSFRDIAGLFDVNNSPNKAIFQTLFYALLFVRGNSEYTYTNVTSGLYNLKELFDSAFDVRVKLKGRGSAQPIDDIQSFLPEFQDHLSSLIAEIYDPKISFKHRDDKDQCIFCKSLGMPTDLP